MGKHVVIMGAGPAGLTAAYQLGKAGIPSTLLERDPVAGGLSRTVCHKGYRFDIGGHRFFTKVKAVEMIWREVLAESDFLHRKRLSRIYFRRMFFDYPLRASNALKGLGLGNSLLIFASYLQARLRPQLPERTYEQWVSNRFGKRLYKIFFESYTEKVWGMPCSEITADWAAQRIKGLSLLGAIKNAILPKRNPDKSKTIKTLINSFDYPRLGPGMMWDTVLSLARRSGCTVQFDSPVTSILWGKQGVEAVRTGDGTARLTGSHFISTLPIRELICKLDPPAPAQVLEAARRLRYRDFITVAMVVNAEQLFPDNWIYIHDPDMKVGRIQNFKNWSPDMVPDPAKTCLGLEYFCFEGDGLWTSPDDELIQLARRELVSLGLAKNEDIEEGAVVRMPKAYPVYDGTFKESLATIRTFLQQLPNLQLIGRNGMHKYNNQDHSMLTALLAVKNILGESHDLWGVNLEEEYHEEEGDDSARGGLAALQATQPMVPTSISESARAGLRA